jgi:phospholipase C
VSRWREYSPPSRATSPRDYTAEQKAADGGLLDKFVQAMSRVGEGCAADGSTVMNYFDGNTVTALWNYTQHFAMNDNSFDTNFGPSTVGAINLISGQTGNGHLARDQVDLVAYLEAVGDGDRAMTPDDVPTRVKECNDFASALDTALPQHDAVATRRPLRGGASVV